MAERLRRTPPWRIHVRRLAPRKTGWKCPYCGNEILVIPATIEMGKAPYGKPNVLEFGFEVFCSNPDCEYDKIVILQFYPPDVTVPTTLWEFKCEITSGG